MRHYYIALASMIALFNGNLSYAQIIGRIKHNDRLTEVGQAQNYSQGITAKAYDGSGKVVALTKGDIFGRYELTVPKSTNTRIEFTSIFGGESLLLCEGS